MFETWRVKGDYFTSAEALKEHSDKVNATYGSSFNIPYSVLGNTYYMLQENPKEVSKVEEVLKTAHQQGFEKFNIYRAGTILEEQPEESEKLISKVLDLNPQSAESYHILAKIKISNCLP